MKTSPIAVGSLVLLLTAAVWDAGRTSLSYLWLPVFAVAAALWVVFFVPAAAARPTIRCFAGPALLWMGVLVVYVLNPTHHWVESVGLLPADPWPFLPGSADPRHSVETVGVSAAALAVFALAFRVGRRQVRILQWWAIAGGGVLAAVVLHQRLIPRRHPIFEVTGSFPYENHYAAFANLVLPVVLMAAVRFRFQAFQRGAATSPAGVCYLSALLIGFSVLLSGSRAGVAWMTLSLAGWLWLSWRIQRNYEYVMPARTRARPYVWSALFVAALGSLAVALHWLWNASANWGREGRFRAQLLADTLAVWRDNPWWGTGPGTFASVFPYYQSGALEGHHVAHTHCEPLQMLAEYGVFGCVVAVLVAVWLWRCARRQPPRQRTEWPSFAEVEGPALLLALGTLAAHSWVDFPLRMPAIVLTASAWLGLLAAHGGAPTPIPSGEKAAP